MVLYVAKLFLFWTNYSSLLFSDVCRFLSAGATSSLFCGSLSFLFLAFYNFDDDYFMLFLVVVAVLCCYFFASMFAAVAGMIDAIIDSCCYFAAILLLCLLML